MSGDSPRRGQYGYHPLPGSLRVSRAGPCLPARAGGTAGRLGHKLHKHKLSGGSCCHPHFIEYPVLGFPDRDRIDLNSIGYPALGHTGRVD